MRSISILGSTGSIGRQTLDIVQSHPGELSVVALAAGKSSLSQLLNQVETFRPSLVALPDAASAQAFRDLLGQRAKGIEIMHGAAGLEAVATHGEADLVVTAVVGFLGVLPTAAAIKKGKTIALANKETLVAAGSVIMPLAHKHKAPIIPVDSEHSAIFQSLTGYASETVSQIILTGSGGPFRTWSEERIKCATVEDALKHPNWSMGPKITIDSATMMNKGLEIIEARWLFDVSPQKIRVVIHPQSILHSAVEFIDGSIVGQMGLPDMRLPIHYALFHPGRVVSHTVPRLDLAQLGALTFEEPDPKKFPSLLLARRVAEDKSTAACVLNAANEVAVEAFLQGHIAFCDIIDCIERVLNTHRPVPAPSLEDLVAADAWARRAASQVVGALAV